MTHRASGKRTWIAGFLAAAVVAMATVGCGPSLMHVGYTQSNKVWYHWVHSANEHTIVVCDVQPDGSETKCVESEM